MKQLLKFISVSMAVALTAIASACASSTASSSSTVDSGASSASSASDISSSASSTLPEVTVDPPSAGLPSESATEYAAKMQAMLDGTGEYASLPVATFETSQGSFKVRLFPAEAPKTVENFITHAKAGYYDGQIFHRVVKDFMIQSGDPSGTGTEGESIWGEPFEDEFSDYMHNFRGALSMANTGMPVSNSSQFFIVQNAEPVTDTTMQQQLASSVFMNKLVSSCYSQLLAAEKAGKTSEELTAMASALDTQLGEISQGGVPATFIEQFQPVTDLYAKLGGAPHLDFAHTVFGYVFEGMDTVDQIASVETVDDGRGEMSKPKEEVKLIKVTISE